MAHGIQPVELGLATRPHWFLSSESKLTVVVVYFLSSGSLTWLLKPRLASPASIAEVEADHPRGVADGNWGSDEMFELSKGATA